MIYQTIQYTYLRDFLDDLKRLRYKGTVYVGWIMASQRPESGGLHRMIVTVRARSGDNLHSFTSPVSEYVAAQVDPDDPADAQALAAQNNQALFALHSGRAEQVVNGLLARKDGAFVIVRAIMSLPLEETIFGEVLRPLSEVDERTDPNRRVSRSGLSPLLEDDEEELTGDDEPTESREAERQ